MGAFENIIHDAEHEIQVAQTWALWNQRLFYFLGVSAFIAGSVAGLSAAVEWMRVATAIAGFLAALFAGLQTVFDPKSKADANWDRIRDLRWLLREADIISEQDGGPRQADLRKLNEELTAITKQQRFRGTERQGT